MPRKEENSDKCEKLEDGGAGGGGGGKQSERDENRWDK